MFSEMSNTLFNLNQTPCLTKEIYVDVKCTMHDTMIRIYKAAKTLKGIDGQTNLAKSLGESPQTVKNWENRGVSQQGIIKAHELIGCSIDYIKGTSDAMSGDGLLPLESKSKAISIAGFAISSAERLMLDYYLKLSEESKTVIDLAINKLYSLENPADKIAKPYPSKMKKEKV
jgi:hypothetical protein